MLDKVKSFLDSRSWKYYFQEAENSTSDVVFFNFAVEDDSTTFHCVVDMPKDEPIMLVYSIPSAVVPKDRLGKVGELINKLNFGRIFGNFELDYNDGEVRYKTSAYYNKVIVDVDWVGEVILRNVVSMGTAVQGILAIANGNDNIDEVVGNITNLLSNSNLLR